MTPRRAALLAALLAAALLCGGAAAQFAARDVTLCIAMRAKRTTRTQHIDFAAQYYAAAFAPLTFTTKFLGVYETKTTPRALAMALVVNGSGCNAYLGPGSSSLVQAVSPLVTEFWVDPAATATELSDKAAYPYFARVVPHDGSSAAGVVQLFKTFGWKLINTLCADNTYGKSVSAGVSGLQLDAGGSVGIARCVSPSSTRAQVTAALLPYLSAESRVVFVGMSSSVPAFQHLVEEIIESKAYDATIFVFSESACSSAGGAARWEDVPGAICGAFQLDEAASAPFLTAYAARNTSRVDAALWDVGYPDAKIDRNSTDIYGAFSADASRFVMKSFYDYFTANPALVGMPDPETLVAFSKNVTMAGGLTGTVALDAKGDRPGRSADMSLFNARPGGTPQDQIATASRGAVIAAALTPYFLGKTYSFDAPPSSIRPVAAANNQQLLMIVLAVAGALLIIALVALLAVFRGWIAANTRNTKMAPTDADKPVTIVFTDIESSTLLWSLQPQEMALAIDVHHEVIRRCVAAHKGYEVKTIGDSFMVAFRAPIDGLRFALAVQRALHEHEWGTAYFDDVYKEKLAYGAPQLAAYDAAWRGIRVRVGAHTAVASVDYDQVAHGYDYYGPAVNCAARIESLGHGGQVLISAEMRHAISTASGLDKFDFVEMGAHAVNGIPEPVEVVQVTEKAAAAMVARWFPKLRTHVAAGAGDGDESDDDGEQQSHAKELGYDDVRSNPDSDNGGSSRGSFGGGAGSPFARHQSGTDRRGPTYAELSNSAKRVWNARKLKGRESAMYAESVHLLDRMLSIVPDKDKLEITKKLCKAWRVDFDVEGRWKAPLDRRHERASAPKFPGAAGSPRADDLTPESRREGGAGRTEVIVVGPLQSPNPTLGQADNTNSNATFGTSVGGSGGGSDFFSDRLTITSFGEERLYALLVMMAKMKVVDELKKINDAMNVMAIQALAGFEGGNANPGKLAVSQPLDANMLSLTDETK
jgi:class 3 adenylate cyclase/ABC-type branched-subunit amino acid transport system substrate-binding protein